MSEPRQSDSNTPTITRREMLTEAAVAVGAATLTGTLISSVAVAKTDETISHAEEAIRQQVTFKAARRRVYQALTDAKEFDQVIRMSAAMQGGMPPGAQRTRIAATPGSEFVLFGGHITGRQVECVTNERIVQAWRAGNWDAGAYSIARFDLVEQGTETKLVFEHTGFPKGQAEHLAAGWKENYWEPLAKFLG